LIHGRSQDFQRKTANADGTFGGVYAGTEPISYAVWPSDSEVVSLAQSGSPNAWVDASISEWLIRFTDAQTALLSPGIYRLQVTAAVSAGRTGVLFDGLLEVGSAPGTTVPSPVNLVTDWYAARLLGGLGFNSAQWESLSDLVAASSAAIRRWCNRDFDLRSYVKEYAVAPNGYVRLDQVPVAQATRVQCNPQTALTVTNPSASVQYATVRFAYTGDFTTQAVTGLTLSWVVSGTQSTSTITFTSGMTIAGAAALINAVGSGWSATADTVLGLYPVTELIDGTVAQGCTGRNGAELRVYSEDVPNVRWHPDSGQSTGMLWVGRQSGGLGPRWGPDWAGWDDVSPSIGMVRVSYTAGFSVIPYPVQLATVELVKTMMQRLNTDMVLKSETAGEYSYTLADHLLLALPSNVLQSIAPYRITNA